MPARASWIVAAVALAAAPAHAKEVDQFSDRLFQLAHLRDASAVIDARINDMLADIATRLTAAHARTTPARDRIVRDEFQAGPGDLVAQLSTPYEYWVRDEAPVDLFWVDDRGIYGGTVDYDDMGLGWYVEIAPVIRIGPLLVGIDKLGHFLTQGWFYYTHAEEVARALPGISDAQLHDRVLAYGHEQEATYLGLVGTGVYSYADLAANWQGYQFYRELFDGPHPYFTLDAAGRYRVAREFHFLDYATDDWDEAENPSRPRTEAMRAKVAAHIRAVACRDYLAAPAAYLHATGRSLARDAYVWTAAEDALPHVGRLALDEICR